MYHVYHGLAPDGWHSLKGMGIDWRSDYTVLYQERTTLKQLAEIAGRELQREVQTRLKWNGWK